MFGKSFRIKKETIKIIDYGSGSQPKVIFYIYDILKNEYKLNVKIYCYDLYNSQYLKTLNQNKDIIFSHIQNLNLNKTKKIYKKRVVKIKKINVPSMAY